MSRKLEYKIETVEIDQPKIKHLLFRSTVKWWFYKVTHQASGVVVYAGKRSGLKKNVENHCAKMLIARASSIYSIKIKQHLSFKQVQRRLNKQAYTNYYAFQTD